jgi:hypothetical protein
MPEAVCLICQEPVELGNQEDHLRTKHATPATGFRFWLDAVAHFADKPSMLIADLRKQCNVTPHGFFVQDVGGQWTYYSDGQAVDLTKEPHFFILLPATM